MGRAIRSLLPTLLLLPLPAMADAAPLSDPIYTGNAPADFIGNPNFNPDIDSIGPNFPYVKVYSDGEPDVGVPTEWAENPEGSSISGMDIHAVWIMYNPSTDVLSVGFQTYEHQLKGVPIIAGDIDGDGDPNDATYETNDYPNFDYRESFCFVIAHAILGDGGQSDYPNWPNYVVGVPTLSGAQQEVENKLLNYFTAAHYLEWEDPAQAFGNDLPLNIQDQSVEPIISPSQAQPHLEFRIPNFSRLPDFGGEFDPKKDALEFYWGAFMGTTSTAPGFGVDEMPVQDSSISDRELLKVTFPSPVGSISGTISQDWDESLYSGPGTQDGPLAGVTVRITGEFEKDVPSPRTVTTNAAGQFTLSGIRMGDYDVQVMPAFGWEVQGGAANAIQKVTIQAQEAENGVDWTLIPSDTDGDLILDQVETEGKDADGDNIPDYQEIDSDGDTFHDGAEVGDDLMNPVDTDGDGKEDYRDRDSDDDGFLDRDEGGSDTNGDGVKEEFEDTDGDGNPDIHDIDSDDDGILDGTEAGVTDATVHPDTNQGTGNFIADGDPTHTSDPDDQDTDDDCIPDGVEDSNFDGVHQPGQGETQPDMADTDQDGIQDGTEQGYTEGVEDTDDGVCQPDADAGATTTDPNDEDTDDGGKSDGDEDVNGNGEIDPGELDPNHAPDDNDSDGDGIPDDTETGIGTDPLDADSDDDGILDGQEDISDHDGDGIIDPLDNDSDNDGLQDGTEVGLTLEDIHPDTDPDGFEPDSDPSTTTDPTDDDSDDDGLEDGTEDQDGDGFQDPDETDPTDQDTDDDGVQDGTEGGLTAPEGDDTGQSFEADDDPSTTTDPLDDDSDDDGLEDGQEDLDGNGAWDDDETDPTEVDTDGDGLQDGTESGLTDPTGEHTDPDIFEPDSDPSTTTDPKDDDSDDDGLMDGTEDADQDGATDDGETDPIDRDSDDDGIQDGTETGLIVPEGDDTNVNVFQADSDPGTNTDPLDDDSDDDGILDGAEDGNQNGAVESNETDANAWDTDEDGLSDGLEDGLTEPQGEDTDETIFVADSDPDTVTDALDDDSDDDGLLDGSEDENLNGATDTGETDNLNVDTDEDCLQDGQELGLTSPQGDDTDLDIFVPDADPETTTDPLSPDTDSGGLPDGGENGEDLNCDGAIDPGETNPADNTDDYGGMSMGGGGLKSCDTPSTGGDLPLGALLLLGLAFALRTRRGLLKVMLPLLCVAMMPTAQAQETSAVEVQQFHPVEDLNGGVMTAGSNTLDQGKVVFGLWVNYAKNPLIYVSATGDETLVQPHLGGADLQIAVGLLDNLQLSANIPGTPVQRFADGNPVTATGDPANFSLNDATVRLRWQLVDIYKRRVGLALEPKLWVPTGNAANYTGGQLNYGGSLIFDVHLGSAWFGTNFGYRKRLSDQNIGNLMVSDELTYRAGFGLPTGPLYVTVDLFGAVGLSDQDLTGTENANKPAEVMLGISKPLKNGATGTLAASTGVLAGYGSPDMRFAAGISCCTPRILDADRDGIVDSEDDCPHEPEDFDDFQDDDGCPEYDNDQDGWADVEDPCPDGYEDLDGFEDDDGCPDPDNDDDSILDVNDQCPLSPEDYDGVEDHDGCPDEDYRDPDRDGDGIPDKFDRCPDDPEDKDGYRDMDGCPEIDNDEDGLIDTEDECPNRPELYNEFEDDDGCPDVKIDPGARITVRSGRIRMNKIYFEFDKDTIMPQSFQTLDAAIQVFKDNPGLRVRIEGHTDNKGSDDYNLNLSARRADSVKNYMVNVGELDSNLFETAGFGETMPVESNNTEQGRALNRRIEWVILDAGIPEEPTTIDPDPVAPTEGDEGTEGEGAEGEDTEGSGDAPETPAEAPTP